MRVTPVSDITIVDLPLPRKRLLNEYSRLIASGKKGGWRRLAERRHVNVKYVYRYAVLGKIPHNRVIRRRLGIRPCINDMFKLPIQAMPPEILRWALEHREEMQ
jgi:hypothetical protein